MIHRNAFRGLSFCKNLYLTNTHIQEIEENAFHRTNNINKLSLMNSRLKTIHNNAFNGAFNIHTIDLRGNYLTSINKTTFGELIMPNLDYLNEMNQRFRLENDSIILLDNINPSEKYVKKILFDQNPIQCDCSLGWLLNKKMYSESITFPEICAGPKGYDCLRISDLTIDSLPCNENNQLKATGKVPCEDLVFDVQKDTDIYSLSVPKGKNKNEDDNNSNDDQNEDYYNENNYFNYDANYYDENKEQSTTPLISPTTTEARSMSTTEHLIKTKSSSISNTLEFLSNNFLSNQLDTTTAKTLRNTKLTTPVIKTTKSPLSNNIVDNHNSRNINKEDFSTNKYNSSLSLHNSGSSNFKFNFLTNNYFHFSRAFFLFIKLSLFVFITFIYYNLY